MPDGAGTADEAETALRGRLASALDPRGTGRPVLLLVEGAAGTGKSRLVDRLAAAVAGSARRTAPGEPPAGAGPELLVAEDVPRAPAGDTARLRALLADPPAHFACVLSYRPEELPAPGLVLGPDTDFPAVLTVVRHVLGPLAVERAALQFEDAGEQQRAVDLLESALATGPVPGQARSRLARLLARCAVVGLRSDETLTVLRHIVADPGLAPAVRGEIRLDLGLLLCNQVGEVMEGRDELARAVDDLSGEPVPLARAMSALAMPYGPDASFAENAAWIERAVTVAEESGDPVVQAAVAANRVSVLLNGGDPAAWPLIERLPRDSALVGCRQQASRGLCNAADAVVWLGHYDASRALLAEGVALAARSGAAYAEQTGRGCALVVDWATGRWPGLAERCRAFVDESGDMPYLASDARMVLGLLALARGEWADALDHLAGPEAAGLDTGPVPISATASGALIRLALAHDDVSEAAGAAGAAWRRLRAKGIWAWGAELAPWAVEAALRSGDTSAAAATTEEFAAGLEGRDAPSADAALAWTRAVLAEHTGRTAEAAARYEESAAAYRELPRPYHEALTSAGAARCALSLGGDGGRAVAALADCASAFDALGATWDAARTRAELRRHQPAAERRPPGRPRYGDVLSPREEEVAELAAAGMSNREIAATLHLSPRTVEQHVARALQKTGVHSRQQLARALGSAAD